MVELVSNLRYGYGSIDDMDEIIALANTWWKDASFYKETHMEFKPDQDLFRDLYKAGVLFIVVGRAEDDSIKACYISIISNYTFNSSYKYSAEVVWCIHEDYRKGREVLRLIASIEQGLTSSGVDLFDLNLPVQENTSSLASYLTKKKGFFQQDLSIFKEIKHG